MNTTEAAPANTAQGGIPKLIPLEDIKVEENHRGKKPDDAIELLSLADNMKVHGLLQPIVVTPMTSSGKFLLVAGARRLAAARLLKWATIEARVMNTTGVQQIRALRATENLLREDLAPVEEAEACAQLVESIEHAVAQDDAFKGRMTPDKLTASRWRDDIHLAKKIHAEACKLAGQRLGKPTEWVRDRCILLRVGETARRLCLEGRLPLAHVKELAKVADQDRQKDLAEEYATGEHPDDDQPGPLDELRRDVSRSMLSLAKVPWDRSVPCFGKPACNDCPNNSLNAPGLFGAKEAFCPDLNEARRMGTYNAPHEAKVPEEGVCTLRACFEHKNVSSARALNGAATRAANAINKAESKADRPTLTPEGLAPFVPAGIDAGQVVKRAKEKLADKRDNGVPKAPSAASQARAEQASAREKLVDGWNKDYRAWAEKSTKKIKAQLPKAPLRRVGMQLLASTKDWTNFREAAKPTPPSGKVKELLGFAVKPTFDGLVELEKNGDVLGYDALPDTWHFVAKAGELQQYVAVYQLVADQIGVKLDEAPKFEEPANEPKAKPAAGKKKKSKKSAKAGA